MRTIIGILETIFIGTIQGITEFLPISSSAHLIIFSSIFQDHTIPLALNVSLHFGTLLAIIYYFRADLLQLLSSIVPPTQTFKDVERAKERRMEIAKLAIATLPACIVGLLFKNYIEDTFHHPIMTVAPLIIIGIALWLSDRYSPSNKQIAKTSLLAVLFIGIAQAGALIPGVSRSGSTIAAARSMGIPRHGAARFSFLMGIPVMLGATILEAGEMLVYMQSSTFYIGILSSFISGTLTIRFLMYFINSFSFAWFAGYRVLLAAVLYYLWAIS